MAIFNLAERFHDWIFLSLNRVTAGWFSGLAARLVFSSVLLMYFVNSWRTKVGDGFPDVLVPNAGAYAQILPTIAEAAGYDTDAIALMPYGLIVYIGTFAEILLPVLILAGLFTRTASVAMFGFIIVMTFVDIQFHEIGAEAVGSMFDRIHNSPVSDQRLLWVFPLVYLTLNGGGKISLDYLFNLFHKS